MIGFDWQKYVVLAKELLQCKKEACIEEAYLRASVSRAYYGIHSISYRFLVQKRGIPIDGKRKHPQTFEILKSSDKEVEKELGEFLKTLYQVRLHADYADSPPMTEWEATCSLVAAEAALGNLRSLGAI